MKNRVISATEFKAKCLSLLDEVQTEGGTVTITKRGRPVATLHQVRTRPGKTTEGAWAGKVSFSSDWMRDRSDLWEVLHEV